MAIDEGLRVVGAAVPRRDGRAKVSGGVRYAVDVRLPGMLHAKVLRSPHAHARLVRVDAERARRMPGVHAVVTRDDLAGLSPTFGYFIKDQPVIATDKVRYIGDPVAAVAADTEAIAVAALALIEVEYDVLPSVLGIRDALADSAVELFEEAPFGIVPAYGLGASASLRPRPNVCYEFRYETGPDDVWDRCDHIFEDTFVFSRMQHFHLEPFVSVADVVGDQIEVWTATQGPFALRKELARVFNHPENRIRVHVGAVGGGFGAKNNCKTEPLAILLSKLSGRPVRYCLTHEEAFLTQSQHAAILTLRSGVLDDGTFVARESEVLLDAGAYSDASPLVAEKAAYRMPGAYRWERISSVCRCVMTTTTPAGAFRGFGGTQATWASESQVDMIARRLGIDPFDLRVQNAKRLGEPFVPGESGIDSDLRVGLDLVADELGYRQRSSGTNRGMGLAIGLKDGGGVNKPAQARVKLTTAGDVYLHCGTIEIGQGATTALSQIVAEILNVPLDRVVYVPVDTDHTPFDQGTNASSGVVVMGQAVARAAEAVRAKVLEFAAGQLDCTADELELGDRVICRGDAELPLAPLVMRAFGGSGFEFSAEGYFKVATDHRAPLEAPCIFWEIGWAGAEVEVDPETGKVELLQLVVSGDAGRAIHRQACEGQDIGAAVMGLGQALFEEMRYEDGRIVNMDALDYRVPMATDLPGRFVAITQEQGHGPGPFGSKGMGEGTMLPLAAAIANAVEDAVGARVTALPLTPERVLAALVDRRPGVG